METHLNKTPPTVTVTAIGKKLILIDP